MAGSELTIVVNELRNAGHRSILKKHGPAEKS
jgi:hypothetical protein